MKKSPVFTILCLIIIMLLGTLSPVLASEKAAVKKEILLDAVVATVNEKPITLQEVGQRMRPPSRLTEEELASNATAQQILEELILERTIEEEAHARNIRVNSADVENYISEVARLNNLSRSEFEEALAKENQDVAAYEQMVRAEILRTRLISELQQMGAPVSEEEVQERLSQHPALAKPGTKVALRQIILDTSNWEDKEAREKLTHIKELVVEGEKNFGELASQFSEGPEASNGGFLGIIAEEELSPMIFNAVFALDNGGLSDIIRSPGGFHVFQLERRFVDSEEERQELTNTVRMAIQNEKIESNLQEFFSKELYKLHTVDRKSL